MRTRHHPGNHSSAGGKGDVPPGTESAQQFVYSFLAACHSHLEWLMIVRSPQDNSNQKTGPRRVESNGDLASKQTPSITPTCFGGSRRVDTLE